MGFGFSLLSLAEIFYFTTVRWIFVLYQENKEKRKVNALRLSQSNASTRTLSNENDIIQNEIELDALENRPLPFPAWSEHGYIQSNEKEIA